MASVLILLSNCSDEPSQISNGVSPRQDGPLKVGQNATAVSYFLTRPGEVVSEGLIVLRTTHTIRIDSVHSIQVGSSATYLGAMLASPERRFDFYQRMRGYPPKEIPTDVLVDAHGATLEPKGTYMLALGYRAGATGQTALRRSVEVDYSYRGETYEAQIPIGVAICVRPVTERQCADRYPLDMIKD